MAASGILSVEAILSLRQAFASSRKACERKTRYPRRKQALGAANLWTKREAKRIYPYRCPVCFKWHLTSRPPESRAYYDLLLRPEYRELLWPVKNMEI